MRLKRDRRQQVEPRHTKRQPFADAMIQINQLSFCEPFPIPQNASTHERNISLACK
jgi:hypothetical protein